MGKASKASDKASVKAKKFAGNLRTAKPKQEGYASIEDFWTDYQQAFVEISKGTLEIQSIDPGDFLLISDTPFVQMLLDKGVDMKDGEAINEAYNTFTDEEKYESFIHNVKKCVCHGVVSVKFVNKSPSECNKDIEVSVDRLSTEDLMTVYNAIKQISVPEEVAEKATEFRNESEGSGEAITEDSPDSESISQVTKRSIIPENN